jgi:predicted dehydrogenase
MKNKQKLRIGVIGCGTIAKDHVGAIRDKCGPTELHLCDKNLKAAEKLKKNLGPEVRVSDDAFEFISEHKFDIVHILTPPDSHFALAKSALENNAHVLIEKPMTLTLKKTESLFVLAKSLGRKVCVDHSLLYMDCVLKMLDRIHSGRMGRVISVYCFFGHDERKKTIPYGGVSHWAYNMSGGPLTNLISHPASVLVELIGTPKDVSITSYARNLMPYGLSDVMHAVIHSAEGHGEFSISMAHGNSSRYIIAECEKGSVLVDFGRQLMIPRFHKGLLGPISKKFGGIGQGFSYIIATMGVISKVLVGKMKTNPGTRGVIEKFYDAVRNGLPCPVSEENAMGVAKILEAFLENSHLNPNRASSMVTEE